MRFRSFESRARTAYPGSRCADEVFETDAARHQAHIAEPVDCGLRRKHRNEVVANTATRCWKGRRQHDHRSKQLVSGALANLQEPPPGTPRRVDGGRRLGVRVEPDPPVLPPVPVGVSPPPELAVQGGCLVTLRRRGSPASSARRPPILPPGLPDRSDRASTNPSGRDGGRFGRRAGDAGGRRHVGAPVPGSRPPGLGPSSRTTRAWPPTREMFPTRPALRALCPVRRLV